MFNQFELCHYTALTNEMLSLSLVFDGSIWRDSVLQMSVCAALMVDIADHHTIVLVDQQKDNVSELVKRTSVPGN